ncbi:hypothetical protein Cni_G04712 [Canna indica]|uniref:Uncharacterized protein n=1 Tax=Canna indica TaxID=4628 RepID=A0AAQ3JXM5_9LILI|nr:hypothetical protein Cni_G04712 [Canna indica]
MGAQQRGDGRRVAALYCAALRCQYHPVELWVRREHRALPEDVRREEPPVPPHSLVDEWLRVFGLVRSDQPQRLPHHRQPHAPRRQPAPRRPPPPPPPQFPEHYTCNHNEHHIEQLKRPSAGIHNSPQCSIKSQGIDAAKKQQGKTGRGKVGKSKCTSIITTSRKGTHRHNKIL